MRRAFALTCALAVATMLGVLNVREDGFDNKGAPVDFGSALANGLIAFVVSAVACCLLALLLVRREGWAARNGARRAPARRRSVLLAVAFVAVWLAGVALWANGRGWGVALVVAGACALLVMAWRRDANYRPDGGSPLGPLDGP